MASASRSPEPERRPTAGASAGVEVVIVGAARTPQGALAGSLASVHATDLAAVAIKAALERARVAPGAVQEVFLGNVLSAGLGQAPAKQAALKAGVPPTVPCTTVNKVCSSGLKAIMFAAQQIQLGHAECTLAGGFESMTQCPYYAPQLRAGARFGDSKLVDGMQFDGLHDPTNDFAMGIAAEICAADHHVSRADQDAFALESYRRAADAYKSGFFQWEIAPVSVPQRKGAPVVVSEDDEYSRVMPEKVPGLRPVFKKDGTVTAANSSPISDGASAVVLTSRAFAVKHGLTVLASIRGYGDASQAPEHFTTSPARAIPVALQRAGLAMSDLGRDDYFEINEAFAVVSVANAKLLHLSPEQVNIHGGAVSLGHPLGSSGSRIVVTLLNVLRERNGRYGIAGICNGGGGASALVIERER